MSHEISIALLELKKDLLFAGGTALSELSPSITFTHLYEVTSKQRKLLSKVNLTLHTLIMDGEPVESAAKGDTILVALSGNAEKVLEAVQKLDWQRKSGKVLRTSQSELVLAAE